MIRTFTAVAGQSLLDVCLNCYNTLDQLYKLIQDNAIDNVNVTPHSGQVFFYDDFQTTDQGSQSNFSIKTVFYATDVAGLGGSVYYPVTTTKTMNVFSTEYISNANGTTILTPIDGLGNTLAGYDILQIELEIEPLKKSQYQWNKTTGTLTLLNGTVVDANQTLYILYTITQ